MLQIEASRPGAVLDASFWTVAFGARLDVFLPRCFHLMSTPLVHREVVTTSRRPNGATYPYAEGFRLWCELNLITLEDPPEGWPTPWGSRRFAGKGEETALMLAAQTGSIALINERPAWELAAANEMPVLNVPGFVAYLAQEWIITVGTAVESLRMIEQGNRTARVFIRQAATMLQRLREDESDA